MSTYLEKLREKMRSHICNDACKEQPATEWWCPTSQRWSWCPGPCPDGTEHVQRERMVFMHSFTYPKEPNCE